LRIIERHQAINVAVSAVAQPNYHSDEGVELRHTRLSEFQSEDLKSAFIIDDLCDRSAQLAEQFLILNFRKEMSGAYARRSDIIINVSRNSGMQPLMINRECPVFFCDEIPTIKTAPERPGCLLVKKNSVRHGTVPIANSL
jgi:hypothetical protein